MQTGKKGLALLLALLMVFSLLPVSALAADGCLTTTGAGKAFSTKQGELLTVGLAQYFTDGDGHTLTYSLDAGDYGKQTKIAKDKDGNDVLSFTNPDMGEYTPTITAKCSNGETASVKLTITVTEGEKGDERQYGYDETPADSVTVYVTVSSDGMPIMGRDGTVLSHLEVKVPYFDLENQGLADFYRYHTENGSGNYVDAEIVERPTALHLNLYMIGKYYMGLTDEEIKTGSTKILGAQGGYGVEHMSGGTAYEDTMLALNITGSATSLYMQQFWGHDENLMYYRNHVYPLMGPGWGSTCDYILLSDGDTIDVAMFSNWSFWQYGAFAAFEQDDFTVAKGNTLTAHTLKYDTKSVADGGTEQFDPITGLNVAVYDADWEYVGDMELSDVEENAYTYTFNEAGTYYLLGLDPNAGETGAESAASYAPATAKVTVTDGSSKPVFDPAEWYKDFDFSSISLDAEGTDYLYNIEESSMYVTHFNNPGDKKVYTVTVPAGTETAYVTYPVDFGQNILEYCAIFDESGTVGWDYSGYEYSVTENEDGSHTIALPAAYLMENNLYIAAEGDNYEYFNCFFFKEGDNTPPSTGDDAKVTGVKLDRSTLTIERGKTAQLNATVEPATANNQNVTWQSSSMKVATVSKKGVVTALSAGTTTITVTTADGGYTAKCTVTVTDPNKPPVNETDGYYEIANGAQLKWFADEVNASSDNASLNARLTADIDLSGICSSADPWTPIGNTANNRKYSGTFDGQNHKITGLYLKNSGKYNEGSSYNTGLFGECDGVTIKNLSVYGTAVAMTRMVGGLAGRTHAISTHRRSTIENCHNYVTFTGSPTNDGIYRHGGLVGSAQQTDFIGCSNEADINGYGGEVGGILGYAGIDGVTLTNCWNTGHVRLYGYQNNFRGVGGLVGSGTNTLTLTNCYNTGAVDFYYRTQKVEQYVGGLVGRFYGSSGTHTLTMTGCYSTGTVSGEYDDNAHMGALVGGTSSSVSNKVEVIAVNSYYLEGSAAVSGVESGAEAFTAEEGLSASQLGESYVDSCPAPVLAGQTAAEHADADGDGKCDTCGKQLAEIAVPTLKEGYPAESTDTVQVGTAYVLSDLQANKVFAPVDGQTLNYKNYYYERSADGGETWGAKQTFPEAVFGSLSIQLTETEVGTYIYRFYASHDGEHFSRDTWTLTLNVEETPTLNFSFYVGKDYNGNYPVIKLYNVTTDSEGSEVLGDEIQNVFLYSDFTNTLPEGEETYDPAQGKLVSNYQMFYASLTAGRYAYRAFARNADTGEYDVALGGMTLNLPTDKNVDGGAGGGGSIYLQCNSFYITTTKADGTYFAADDYYIRVDCPLMGTSAEMGEPYMNGNYASYPTVLYAAGNACLYNTYAYPKVEGYIFTQAINQTYPPSYSAGTKTFKFDPAITLTVTVPQNATFGLYFQWNNFNTTEVEPGTTWKDNGDGTKSAEYFIPKGNSSYTWRLSDSTHVTQAGWLPSQNVNAEMKLLFDSNSATNRVSHDFSQLGTQAIIRDEADLQLNLAPSGYEAIGGTTRVRAYRHWELINSDTANIMVEPDFHWNIESGDASIETVNGGNAGANWADITPGTQDSIITVYYDSIDVNHGNYGSHGGLYPATQPQRIGVIVVGGTGVAHGTADADVDFNMEPGKTTTRSLDWDYNYDTWFYEASETDPALDFAVTATGAVTVEYAFVNANNAMDRTVTGFTTAEAGEDGRYAVPLKAFNELGSGMGGTVIIKMTDDTGVSYRLVRAAKVTITAENVSHPKEDIMPGDQVKLTFSGMFRGVDKFSGIFNPVALKPTYYDGSKSFTNTLGQYQKMDNASVTVTVPADIEFAEGEETAVYTFTNGYTSGGMFSAANPFATIYGMTDTGAGTNFNAVMVSYYVGHYADAAVTVHRKVTYDTQLIVPDASGNALEGVTVILTGADGAVIEPDEETGRYTLGYGDYSYILSKDGYAKAMGKFSLGGADAEKVGEDGILTVTGKALRTLGENAWDGTTKTEPKTDDNGVYQIGTASELAWFADAVNGGQTTISAKLIADIELGSFDWTPIGSNSVKYGGTFDGSGHVVRNIYINSTAMYQALFGYLSGTAKITDLGVTGIVVTTNGFASGIAGYMENSSVIDGCFNAADVTAAKSVSGIGNGQSAKALIQNSYNTGTITATGTSGLAGGITSGNSTNYTAGITNCYNTGTVTAVKSYGPLTPRITNYNGEVTNCYYLEGSCNYALTKLGTAKTAEELKTSALILRLGTSFAVDSDGINGGFPVLAWQGGTQPVPVEGDVNLDGKADASDAQLVYDYSLGKGTFTEVQLKIADMDGDGHITAKDAAMIYAIIAAPAAVTE